MNSIAYCNSNDSLNDLQIQCDKDRKLTVSTLVPPKSCALLEERKKNIIEQNKEIINKEEELTYEWNGERYCFFNKKREPVSCF